MFLKRSVFFTICLFALAHGGFAADFMSPHGVIKNVQNYSSMPGWRPDGPYNQKMPQPVYVMGPDLKTDDCQRAVADVVDSYCSGMNYCLDMKFSDARPAMIVSLSRLPGHSFATACAGYLEPEFNVYVNKHSSGISNTNPVAFPGVNYDFQSEQTPKSNWMTEYAERSAELESLQAQNGAGLDVLYHTDMPTTFADLDFATRQEILAAGYEPYKDTKAYQEIKIEDYDTYKQRINQSNGIEDSNLESDDSIPDELDVLLPWYGILVVKKGSLDDYANSDTPIISSEYMKEHKSQFYPDNSNKPLGMLRGCTHGNHTANDKDVVNQAAHKTMGEDGSFWSGNDYYVYDGEDVYWGWVQLAGEIALALLTMGISAEVEAGTVVAQTSEATANAVKGVGKSVKAVNVIKNSAEVKKAATVAKNVTAATKVDAINELGKVGVTVNKTASVAQISKIGQILLDAKSSVTWVSALKTNPWKLVKAGAVSIKPTAARLFGKGVTWTDRIKRAVLVGVPTGIGIELIKAFGYSTAALSMKQFGEKYANVKFNGFGLLSADDLEGRENEVSHGAWLMFEESGTINQDDARNEALRWAEEFQKDMTQINNTEQLCDVDIYVVQPGISNSAKTGGKQAVYYSIMNPGGSLRVSKN